MTKAAALKLFFNAILKGESVSYNDYGFYVCTGTLSNCYRSYIKGSSRFNKKFPTIPNDLETYTIKHIIVSQALPKDSSTGKLFGVGRYQIIPATLLGLIAANKTDTNQIFNEAVQDNFALYLLLERKNLKNYLTKAVPETKETLEAAALDLCKIWSSIGLPYAMQVTWNGTTKNKLKNESYYSERVGVKTEDAQAALKELRINYNSPTETIDEAAPTGKSGLFFLIAIALAYYIYNKNKK